MLQKAQRAEIVAEMENGGLLRSLHDRLAPKRPWITTFSGTASYDRRIASIPIRLGPIRLGPIRLGPIRLGPIRLGPIRLGPIRLGPNEW
jgi:hypothetical protein